MRSSAEKSFVWIRSDLAQAVLDNGGELPDRWDVEKRSSNDWGWCRACVLEKKEEGTEVEPLKLRRRTAPKRKRRLRITVTIRDAEFAPRHLQDRTISFAYDAGDNAAICDANAWWASDYEATAAFGVSASANVKSFGSLKARNAAKAARRKKPPTPAPPDDLTKLTHLHEPAVVYCLRRRYQRDAIYTYTGENILLALNPFRALPGLYGPDVIEKYSSGEDSHKQNLPPHVYAVARDAHRSMTRRRQHQSILVSGESGSGKTVTTKLILSYLTSGERILRSNPILESFGNARTVRNDNSSRFGKFMELNFSGTNVELTSACIETYLLEKVRLILQAPGERNYHVFYEVLAGVDDRRKFFIEGMTPRHFRMTNGSGTFDRRDGVGDADTFAELKSALATMGFTRHQQRDLWTVVCALLHASNLTFREARGASELDADNESLRPALALLGVPAERLEYALCHCEIQAGGETFRKNLTVAQATKAVEALIKATYGATFTYVCRRVNESIAETDAGAPALIDDSVRIGVLDIFGFESFAENSFEQLCINYCNEALQQQFNRFVFKLEQEEYEREGIDWSFIAFPDNQDVLDLIEKKREGILSILDEQCRLATCTDKTFCHAVYKKCQDHPRFSATSAQKVQLEFSIHHYAGMVTYNSRNFLEKNKDELPKESTDLLMSSSLPFLANLGEILSENPLNASMDKSRSHSPSDTSMATASTASMMSTSTISRGSVGEKRQNPLNRSGSSLIKASVGIQFSQQLQELRSRIECTTPHYVRCLKPNDDLVAQRFEPHIIADQLRCAGVLEAIRVSRVGFPHRYTQETFLERFGILSSSSSRKKRGSPYGRRQRDARSRCTDLIEALTAQVSKIVDEGKRSDGDSDADDGDSVALGMQMGNTKVFLRRRIYEALEQLREKKLSHSAIIIQKYARRMTCRSRFQSSVESIIRLQCFARRIIALCYCNNLRYFVKATRIQTVWRRCHAETTFMAAQEVAFFVQRCWRGRVARQMYAFMTVDKQAAIIQRYWRRHRDQCNYLFFLSSCVIVQCQWRRRAAIREVRELKRKAKTLDAIAAERDKYKEESRRLREELNTVKESSGCGSSLASRDEEVDNLKKQILQLQMALAESRQFSVIDQESPPSELTPASYGWPQGSEFSGHGEFSSVGPVSSVKRRLEANKRQGRDSTKKNVPNRFSFASPEATGRRSPSVTSTTTSLLDADDSSDYLNQSGYVPDSPSKKYKVLLSPRVDSYYEQEPMNHGSVSLDERRGYEFSEELRRLHNALQSDNHELVKQILGRSHEMHLLINEAAANGRTALHIAVLSRNLDTVCLLIDNSAFVNSQDFDGETPLHLAEGSAMSTMLLDRGRANANIPNCDGICALHLAVQRRDVGAVRSLIRFGARVDSADNIRWFTPLHLVALPEHSGIVGSVEERGRSRVAIANLLCGAEGLPEPDIDYQDIEGNSPLHYAVQIETEEANDVIRAFLDNGADACVSNGRKQQALLLLCHNDVLRKFNMFPDCIKSMLDQGADPNHQSYTGCTALHLSLYHRDIASAVILIKQGAELHLKWKKPKRWNLFWTDTGSSDILAFDMVTDDQSLHRLLSAIVAPPKLAPARAWCMHCRTQLGTFSRIHHCGHCRRSVCKGCVPHSLDPSYFPESFRVNVPVRVCSACEVVLTERKVANERSFIVDNPLSSFFTDDGTG